MIRAKLERAQLGLLVLSGLGGVLSAGACSPAQQETPDSGLVVSSDAKATVGDAAASTLTELAVSATSGAPPITLAPAFSPDIHDYSVACQVGTNPMSVSMSAAKGGTTQLLQPTSSAVAPSQTLPVSVPEGGAIVVVVKHGAASSEYWVRCLPHDFPAPVWLPHAGAEKLAPGYYLVGGWWPVLGIPGYAEIFDSNGAPVWFSRGPGFGVADVVALKPNTVTFYPDPVYGSYYPYETLDLTTKSKTVLAPSSSPSSQHEIILLENGDYLVLTTPLTTGVDLTGLTMTNRDGSLTPLGPNESLQDCAIVEFQPDGNVVHSWLASDHFDPVASSTYAALGAVAQTGGQASSVIDVFHCNSIDIDPASGNLLISARHMNSVFFVDWKGTQKVLWKMGGKNASKDHALYVPVDDPFVGQHDARLVAGWSPGCHGGTGQISLFDDETFTKGIARAVIYDVVVGGDSSDAGTVPGGAACPTGKVTPGATLAWEYKGIQFTGLGGSLRIAADGTRLIGWGSYGASGWVFSEVAADGTDLLDLHFGDKDTSYRTIKVPLSTFDLETLRTTAGLQ
jgi:hypothetical protein